MSVTSQRKFLLLLGVLGPLVFAIATVVVATTRTSYHHGSQFISELGESGAEFAWLMNYFGFMLSGALILIFVVYSRTLLPRGYLNIVGSIFLAAFAICMFLAGIFSCDAGCSQADPTPEQNLHDLVSVIAFPAFIFGTVMWGVMFLRSAGSRGFGAYSLATGALAVVVLVAMVQSEATREGTGTWQRLFLGLLFTWLMAVAVRLWRRSPSSEGA